MVKFGTLVLLFRISPRVVSLFVSFFKSLLGLQDLVFIRSTNVMFCLFHLIRSLGPNPFCLWGVKLKEVWILCSEACALGHFQPHQHYILHREVGSKLAESLLWPFLVSPHQCSWLGKTLVDTSLAGLPFLIGIVCTPRRLSSSHSETMDCPFWVLF